MHSFLFFYDWDQFTTKITTNLKILINLDYSRAEIVVDGGREAKILSGLAPLEFPLSRKKDEV